jgi:hypothetical protein
MYIISDIPRMLLRMSHEGWYFNMIEIYWNNIEYIYIYVYNIDILNSNGISTSHH